MEKNSSYAVKLAVRYLISAVISFFLYLSVTVIMTGMFTNVVGYTAYNKETNEVLYHYYEENGPDTLKAEYEAKGIEVTTVNLRSSVSGKPQFFSDLICQIVTALITFAFVHGVLWRKGDSDENLVQFSHIEEDKLRGFKIGLLASIPNFAAFIIAVVAKLGYLSTSFMALYRFMNYQFFTIGNLCFSRVLTDYSAVSWGRLIASASIMIILPVLSGICYILGYKHISISEKLIYKTKKETK